MNTAYVVTALLLTGVIAVNGATDAPNAIATAVSSRALKPRPAVALAAVCNFLGTAVMTAVNAKVAETVSEMVDFGMDANAASCALCAALTAIVIWAAAAWAFGIPTSESHALIAGLSGAAIALSGGMAGIRGAAWSKALYGLLLSAAVGFLFGFLAVKIVLLLCKNADRQRTAPLFRRAQICGAAAMAFMHGAQDGQKFIGVFLLGEALANGRQPGGGLLAVPVGLMLFCSVVMAAGTSVGGWKIMKSVGMDMAKLEPYQGFAADLAAAVCLLFSSLLGMPVSTTHTKTTAIMGAGAAKRFSSVNWSMARDMALAWAFTFPGCGAIGFVMAKIFLLVFR